ncbi:CIA30 family protein [Vibrio breoganii]|uniref:CIA30 family protein n=1 Tax=Vibrio breoganii TaxID=553239 RepID=UPI000C8382C2|nr:CIA30 family protein [Vibrio breoganii]PMM00326.1 exonuclease [Vibrio breoganii]PMN62927.1 exonuclease [Vibrio breoganii]
MIDFTQPNEHQQWQAVNDNVMGGISQGHFTFDGNYSLFEGELSLANNGGFSSINRSIEPLSANKPQVELSFIGDGRTYQLRLSTWKNGDRITYKHEFSTTNGTEQTKVFQLDDFQAIFRGRLIMGAPTLVAQEIEQIGFLIADKKAGPFSLKLLRIQFKTNEVIH